MYGTDRNVCVTFQNKKMKNLIIITLLSIICLSIGCKELTIEPTQACQIPAVDSSAIHPRLMDFQLLLDEYTAKGLPGISVLVNDDSGAFTVTSGYADMDKDIEMLPCHVSKMASVTKMYIGALAMRLVEEGAFELDDPLTDWLSSDVIGKVANAEQSTIRQCLNHTTGVMDLITVNSFYLQILNNPARFWEPEDLLKFTYNKDALFPVGTDVRYSNTNLLLAAMVMEAATGRPHEDLLKQYIIDPLQLTNTYYHWHDDLPDNTAQGYLDLYNNGTVLNLSEYNTGSGNGYGGLYSDVYDMQVFTEALFKHQTLLQPATLDTMLTFVGMEEEKNRSIGITVMKDLLERAPDEFAYGHRGRDLAYTSDAYYFPNQDITLVYLVNYGTNSDTPIRDVFEEFRIELIDEVLE